MNDDFVVFSDSGNNPARKAQHEVIRGSKKLSLHYTLGQDMCYSSTISLGSSASVLRRR